MPRIIPACAGSTGGGGGRWLSRGDHPRMRGEHTVVKDVRQTVLGSSPHARGARIKHTVCEFTTGIIPACAGSTLLRLPFQAAP